MLYKKGKTWMIRLKHRGKQFKKSAHTLSKKLARQREAAFRVELDGNTKRGTVPALRDFIKDYLKFVEASREIRPATKTYYTSGTQYLLASQIADRRMNAISSQDTVQLSVELSTKSASTLNCALRTLRRILFLAREWRIISEVPPLHLATGENQRKRVLSPAEQEAYLAQCSPRWRDAATIILGTGLRPGEVFALRWENITFTGDAGHLHVAEGKSEAARRTLPLVPRVLAVIRERHHSQGKPTTGWVFPARTVSGHATGDGSRTTHLSAIERSGVLEFPPYILRHTALTQLGINGTDVFTLARIAGHSSITMTQRYVHPPDDALLNAFGLKGKHEK